MLTKLMYLYFFPYFLLMANYHAALMNKPVKIVYTASEAYHPDNFRSYLHG